MFFYPQERRSPGWRWKDPTMIRLSTMIRLGPGYVFFILRRGARRVGGGKIRLGPGNVSLRPGAGPAQPERRNGGRLRAPDPGRNPGGRRQLKHEFLDGGADDVTLATLGEVLLEPTLTTLGNFLVRSNSQSSVASASFAVEASSWRATP